MTHTALISQISENGNRQGFLDAMNLVGKLSPNGGHPLEPEVLDRVYQALEKAYAERFKGGGQ